MRGCSCLILLVFQWSGFMMVKETGWLFDSEDVSVLRSRGCFRSDEGLGGAVGLGLGALTEAIPLQFGEGLSS